MCVNLDGLNAEHKWVTILGHTSLHFTFTKLVYVWLGGWASDVPFEAQIRFTLKYIFKIITRYGLIAIILFLKSNLCIAMTENTGI